MELFNYPTEDGSRERPAPTQVFGITMKTLKPEFVNALDKFIVAIEDEGPLENWFTRRRIVVALEWMANSIYFSKQRLIFFPDSSKPAVFTEGYSTEVEIGGSVHTIFVKLDDYTETKGTPADGVDTKC